MITRPENPRLLSRESGRRGSNPRPLAWEAARDWNGRNRPKRASRCDPSSHAGYQKIPAWLSHRRWNENAKRSGVEMASASDRPTSQRDCARRTPPRERGSLAPPSARANPSPSSATGFGVGSVPTFLACTKCRLKFDKLGVTGSSPVPPTSEAPGKAGVSLSRQTTSRGRARKMLASSASLSSRKAAPSRS